MSALVRVAPIILPSWAHRSPDPRILICAQVNNLRLYGAVLGLWTSSTGFAVAVRDNSSDKSVAGVWSLGVISISALAFSAMFLYHTEEFWTKLGILGPPVDPKKLAKLTSGNEATEEEEEPPGLMMMPLKKPTVEVAQPPPVAATRLNLPRIQLRLGRVGKKKE
ncbi:TPA: hypothetical protein N0F65_006820 [Lagenidium giganteum]|uniref:Uncharacterized protein n=1 Tax=Lagenidium giganteum TaxID=4803 RepID=A0AAV2Z8C8_9STRA|nr:TPA: hypothetical protein N0F65_006820 [Lagenidium giganteum]